MIDNDMDIGLVTGNEVTIDRDGDSPVRMIQCQLSEEDDTQTVELIRGHGIDECPVSDFATAIILKIGNYSVCIGIDDAILSEVDEGEKEIYSILPVTNTKAASILLKADGTIECNGNTDFAVAFNDLKTGFDQLKSDFNTFVTTIYNLHNHPTAPTGPVSVPSVTGSSTSASIDASKVDTVKLP